MQLQDYCFFLGFLLWGRWGEGGGGVGEGYELITRKTSHDVSIAVSPDREEKCYITKIQICEIMGLDRILRKNKMKKAAFPKISLLVHWNWRGDNYKHLLCSEDSAQIVLNLAGVETWCSRLIFWRIYNSGVIGAYKAFISPEICTNRLIFGKWTFFIVFFLDMPTYPIISLFLWRRTFSCLLLYMILVD